MLAQRFSLFSRTQRFSLVSTLVKPNMAVYVYVRCMYAALLLLYCCFTAALLICWYTCMQGAAQGSMYATLLVLYCCFVASLLLLYLYVGIRVR